LTSSSSPPPARGDIWTVDFDPSKGAEIQKQRPAVVISSNRIGRLPLKLVAPITGWKPVFATNIWHVQLVPTAQNGLTKESAADALQIRSVSLDRFIRRLGRVTENQVVEIVQALAAIVELR
jgi:mRNA interferase MazF